MLQIAVHTHTPNRTFESTVMVHSNSETCYMYMCIHKLF